MTPDAPNRGELFVSVDGPGGVGKSTLIAEIAATLAREGTPVRVTAEPTHTPLGDLLRYGTDTYQGMALACLVAGDRRHHIEAEIMPALAAGEVVVSDRYLPSSLVLQRMDRLDWDTIWRLNAGTPVPDLVVIVNADPELIGARLAARGAHSRFERQPGSSSTESRLYRDTADRLARVGWPVLVLDATADPPQRLAAMVCDRIPTTAVQEAV
jgi:dTMP kinase